MDVGGAKQRDPRGQPSIDDSLESGIHNPMTRSSSGSVGGFNSMTHRRIQRLKYIFRSVEKRKAATPPFQ
jgi:hypothetical protein